MDRILKMGDGTFVQHPLDGCLFLAFDRKIQLTLMMPHNCWQYLVYR